MSHQVSSNGQIQSFVFLDVETTGLYQTKPRVTELSLVARHRNALLEQSRGHMQRVIDKLTLCVYPMKHIPPQVTDVTGKSVDT